MTTHPPFLAAIQGKRLIPNHWGDLVEIDERSHEIARQLASDIGIELGTVHFEVLDFLPTT
jgi:sulfur relay (sulfurtransferase) DsrC/TusE family protein